MEKCRAQIDKLKIKYDGFSDNVPQLTLTTSNRLHKCRPPPSWDRLLLQGRVHLDLEFYGGLPPQLFSWYASCDWWRVRFLVVPFPPCSPPHLGYLLAWTLVLACFFFSPFLRSLSFYKIWQGFIRLHIQWMRCSRLVFLVWLYFTLGRQINTSG